MIYKDWPFFFFTLGICYLCLAQHSSEGFYYYYFFLELKTEHVSSEQPPSFVKNATADKLTAAEDRAEPFWCSRLHTRAFVPPDLPGRLQIA